MSETSILAGVLSRVDEIYALDSNGRYGRLAKEAADLLRRTALPDHGGADAGVKLVGWNDPQVQLVYKILCDNTEQPENEHWEGFAARRIIAALSNPVAANASAEAKNALYWAVGRWNAEVLNRPLQNIHRRSLDDTWRQVMRHFGGNDRELCGPTHDELLDGGAHPHASDCDKQGATKSEGIGLAQAGTAREAPGSATGCSQRPNTQVDALPSDRTADVTEDQMARAWKSEQNRYEILIFGGNRPCQVTCDGSLAFTGADEDCETFIRTRCARALLDAFAVGRR